MPITTLFLKISKTKSGLLAQLLQENTAYETQLSSSTQDAIEALRTSDFQFIAIQINEIDASIWRMVSDIKRLGRNAAIIVFTDSPPLDKKTASKFKASGADDALSLDKLSAFALDKIIQLNIQRKQSTNETLSVQKELSMNANRISLMNEIFSYESLNDQDFLDFSLHKVLELTQSMFGYIYLYDEPTETFTLNSWSKEVMKECAVMEPQTCYELNKTGFWGEAVRQRKPLILNDFQSQNPLKKGYPEGHVPLQRFMTAPIFSNSKIIAVVGAANKVDEYTEQDVQQLQLLMNSVWHIIEMRKNETRIRELFAAMQHSPVSIIITDTEGNIQLTNQYFEKITGYSFDEVKGKNPRILKSGAQSTEYYKKLWDTISSGKTWTGELLNRSKSGRMYWESATISPVLDPMGNITKYVAVKKDITDEKLQKEETVRSQRLLEATQSIAKSGGWEFNLEANQMYWTKALYEIHGLDPGKDQLNLVDQSLKCYSQKDQKMLERLFKACIEKGTPYELSLPFTSFDGEKKWVRTKTSAIKNNIGKIVRVVGTLTDISQEVENTQAFETIANENIETKKKLESLLSHTNHGLAMTDIDGNYTYTNDAFAALLGYSKEEILTLNAKDVKTAKSHNESQVALEAMLKANIDIIRLEQQYVHKKGTIIWTDSSVNTMRDEDIKVNSFVESMVDITARKAQERALIESRGKLQESAERTKLLADYATELIHFKDKNQIYNFLAKETHKLIGDDSIIVVSELNDDKTEFEIQAVEDINTISRTVLKMIGQRLVGMKGPVSKNPFTILSDKDVADLPLDIGLITNADFEKKISNKLLKILGIKEIKSINLRDNEKDIATVSIVSKKANTNIPLELLRAIFSQAALAISRAKSIESIIYSEKTLREAQSIAKLGSWQYNRDKDAYRFSEEALRILGLTASDSLNAEGLTKIVHPDDLQLMHDKHLELHKGKTIEFEHRIIRNNEIIWLSAISKPIFNATGELYRAEGTLLDITSRKVAEIQIIENELRFKSLIENSSDIIAIENKNFEITYISPSVKTMLGFSEKEVIKTSGKLFVHPDDQELRDKNVTKLFDGSKQLVQFKERLRKKDGQFIWTLVTFSNQLNVPGIDGFVLNIKNIDQDERNLRALAESHQRFELAAAATKDIIWDYDFKKNIITTSENFTRVFGHEMVELDGEKWTAYAHPDDRVIVEQSFLKTVQDPLAHSWKLQYRFRKHDDEYAWVMNNATILRDDHGKAYRLIGAINDITESKLYEKSIQLQNNKLRDVAWMQSHLVRAPLANLLSLIDLLKFETNGGRKSIEDMIFKSATDLDNVIRNIIKNSERLEGIDNTSIAQRYDIVKESIDELYLHPALLDMSERPYTICNKEGHLIYVNKALKDLCAIEFKDVRLKNQFEALFSAESNREKMLEVSFKLGKREPFESDMQINISNGSLQWVRLNAQPFISKEGLFSGYLYMLRDISFEMIAQQTILEKSETLAHINDELKHFTYTISHDLKEPVNSLTGLINLLKLSAQKHLNEEESEYIKMAEESAERISAMIKALLEYSKSGTEIEKSEVVSVEEILQEVRTALKMQIEKNHAQVIFHNTDQHIKAHPVQFSRILQNLINNSIKFKSGKKPRIDIWLDQNDLHWILKVKDNGRGIASDDIKHVFDLFYFKSEIKTESHGIGLAVVKRLVEQHEGSITVESEPGKGTTFIFTISKFIA